MQACRRPLESEGRIQRSSIAFALALSFLFGAIVPAAARAQDDPSRVWERDKALLYRKAANNPSFATGKATTSGTITYAIDHPNLVGVRFEVGFTEPELVLEPGTDLTISAVISGVVIDNANKEAGGGHVGTALIFAGSGSIDEGRHNAVSRPAVVAAGTGIVDLACDKTSCATSAMDGDDATTMVPAISVTTPATARFWVGVGMLNCGHRCLALYRYRPGPRTNSERCDGKPATLGPPDPEDPILIGTEGDDVIIGSESGDLIEGRGGNDHICGLGGDDTLIGGDGRDRIVGGTGDDTIYGDDLGEIDTGSRDRLDGGPGNDTINGGGGPDRIECGDDNDICAGDGGGDTIFGGPGLDLLFSYSAQPGANACLDAFGAPDASLEGADADSGATIKGGAGLDIICGGPGNDHLFGSTGDDVLIGYQGEDVIRTGPSRAPGLPEDARDLVSGGPDNDRLFGGKGSQRIKGGSGDDRIFGLRGRDTLSGGDDDDIIDGGKGPDSIIGGAHNAGDTCSSARHPGDRVAQCETPLP